MAHDPPDFRELRCRIGNLLSSAPSRLGEAAFAPEDAADQTFLSELMEARSETLALEVLAAAAESGYDASALVDLLDYARTVASPALDGIRREFVTIPDPRGRL